MKWYAAHVLMVILRDGHSQKVYPVYENIFLVQAQSPRAARTAATRLGRFAQKHSGRVKTNGHSAKSVFLGIRKLSQIFGPVDGPVRDDPTHGAEITWNYLEVTGKDSLRRLANGKPVQLKYVE